MSAWRYISTVTDLRNEVSDRLGDASLAEIEAVTEALRAADHPPWGADWAEWLGANFGYPGSGSTMPDAECRAILRQEVKDAVAELERRQRESDSADERCMAIPDDRAHARELAEAREVASTAWSRLDDAAACLMLALANLQMFDRSTRKP